MVFHPKVRTAELLGEIAGGRRTDRSDIIPMKKQEKKHCSATNHLIKAFSFKSGAAPFNFFKSTNFCLQLQMAFSKGSHCCHCNGVPIN